MISPKPTVRRGYRLALCGLARDCEAQLGQLEELVNSLKREGMAVECFIGENGSRDGTRTLLDKLQTAGVITLYDTAFMSDIPHRLARLAAGREYIKNEMCKRGPFDFACVIDLDNVLDKGVNIPGFLAAVDRLISDEKLFAVSAFSLPYYYDLLALERVGMPYGTIDRGLAQIEKRSFSYYQFFRDVMYPLQRQVTIDPPAYCISAFNGLCIYKYASYTASSYMADGPASICEHVVFNRRINQNDQKFVGIEPMLCLAMPTEHGPQNIVTFFFTRVFRILRESFHRIFK